MNEKFGSDVYNLRVETKNSYGKISCKVEQCPFDLWMKYSLDPDQKITNLKMFRYIISGHDPCCHLDDYKCER